MKKLAFSYKDLYVGINLNEYSFEDWIEFAFNHPVAEKTDDSWYWQDEWEWNGDVEHIIKYCIRLFRSPNFLLEKYSSEQLNQGFWYLLGTEQLADWVWDKEIEWTLREDCLMSMVETFNLMFRLNPIEDVCYMWWDLLRDFSKDQDSKVIDTMFAALTQILEIDSINCQISALHGLGHLNHSGKKKAIEEFLKKHPNLDEETKN